MFRGNLRPHQMQPVDLKPKPTCPPVWSEWSVDHLKMNKSCHSCKNRNFILVQQIWFVLSGEFQRSRLTSPALKLTERAFARTDFCQTSWRQVLFSCCCSPGREPRRPSAFMETASVSCLHRGRRTGRSRYTQASTLKFVLIIFCSKENKQRI